MEEKLQQLVDKLEKNKHLELEEYELLINKQSPDLQDYVTKKAQKWQHTYYSNEVYIRGLIEFTNYCKNDCLYCGIRHSNKNANRYRLSEQDILQCSDTGYELGFRTFVLQGGEDPYFTPEKLAKTITALKLHHPDCAITLSFGEHDKETYRLWKKAGADRYLLRHETADFEHYAHLHPQNLSAKNRQQCLWDLKELGFQVGTGFMVGSPGQTAKNLAQDLAFIEELQPSMVGIGPFIPHHDTPFKDEEGGTLEQTLLMIGLLRLLIPYALLPSTTALGTINPQGREAGILAGANVVMPNLSPTNVRAKYLLYDGKICTGDEAAECRGCMERRMNSIGYNVAVNRGDVAQVK